MITLRIPLALLLWSCLLSALSAQPAEIEATASSSRRSYETQRILDQAPVIDGDLSDPCWEQVEWGTGFTQLTPADGAAPTQETAFKILYDEKNLYLGFRCHDSSPDSVVSATARPLRADFWLCGPEPMPPAVPSSTSVFHAPQASHLPAQRACTEPQFWQMN